MALAGWTAPAPAQPPCSPDASVRAELEAASLTPPPGAHPFDHWREALERMDALLGRRPSDIFVRRRRTLLRRRLLRPPLPLPQSPSATDLYLAGLVRDEQAVALWTRAAELEPDLPWVHLSLARAARGDETRPHAIRFLDLCPDSESAATLNAQLSPPRKSSPRVTDQQHRPLRPIVQYRLERARFDRIRTTGLPASWEARQAFWRMLLAQSDSWIRRWPGREFAWRDRLLALYELERAPKQWVRDAADGALAALSEPDGVWFGPDDTRLRIARAYVRHGVRLDQVEPLLTAATTEPGPQAERRAIAALEVRSALAIRLRDADHLRSLLPEMRAAIRSTKLQTADRAARERDYRLAAAWMFSLRGQSEAVVQQLELAFNARPIYGRRPGPDQRRPEAQNSELHRQGLELWLQSGRAADDWEPWITQRTGIRIKPQLTNK